MVKKAVVLACLVLVIAAEIVALNAILPIATTVGMRILNQFPSSGGPPVPVKTAVLKNTGPGSLVTATTMPGVTRTFEGSDLMAARVVYRSTSGDTGEPTVVSGSVFTPKGKAPEGGWPVVAFGHATLGIDPPCAPSLSPSLLGMLRYVTVLANLGYAVALADYQGLGVKGIHPYSDARTAGLNMIDAVRALRHTFSDVSDRWAAVGDSQGAGGAWAADELAGSYAPELHLVGALAASPPADMAGLVDKAQNGTLTSEQRAVMQAVVESLARLHSDVNRDDFRRGAAAHYWNVLSDCSEAGAYRRGEAVKQLGPRDFTPRTPEAADRLRELLQQWALPQKPLSAPLYVWYGGQDPFIDAAWTKAAIERTCAQGGVVTIRFDPNGGHNPPDAVELIKWLNDRFKGLPAQNDC
jgi:Secretory lipase